MYSSWLGIDCKQPAKARQQTAFQVLQVVRLDLLTAFIAELGSAS